MQASARIRIPVEGKISMCTRVYRLKLVVTENLCTHMHTLYLHSAMWHTLVGNHTKILVAEQEARQIIDF